VCALVMVYVEGYGTNDGLPPPSQRVTQFLEACYWSVTVLLGGADKGATTIAGRLLFMGQAFFTLIFLSIYTGNIASFLINTPTESPIYSFSDITDLSSFFYDSNNIVCYAAEDPAIKEWIDFEASLSPDAQFKTIEKPRVKDCIEAVYLEEATCTFYDSPILLASLAQDYYAKGKCGNPGGYCSDPDLTDRESCECPKKVKNNFGEDVCPPDPVNTWTEVFGNLVMVGDTFKPFGYGLGFRREKGDLALNATLPSWHVPTSQLITHFRDEGFLKRLAEEYIPGVDQLQCTAAEPDDGDSEMVLQVEHLLRLLYITAAITSIGCALGYLEAIMRYCISLCPQNFGEAGEEYLANIAAGEEEEEGGREETNSPREFFYCETDCDDPAAGELHRMNLAHFQLEATTQRLQAVEKVLLKMAMAKNLLENVDDFDENLEKIRPAPEEEAPETAVEVAGPVAGEGNGDVDAEGDLELPAPVDGSG